MNDDLEKQFEAIASKAIADAEQVECDLSEFVEGLKLIRSEINQRIEMEAGTVDVEDDE